MDETQESQTVRVTYTMISTYERQALVADLVGDGAPDPDGYATEDDWLDDLADWAERHGVNKTSLDLTDGSGWIDTDPGSVEIASVQVTQ